MDNVYIVQCHRECGCEVDDVFVFATREDALKTWREMVAKYRGQDAFTEDDYDEPTDNFFYGVASFICKFTDNEHRVIVRDIGVK